MSFQGYVFHISEPTRCSLHIWICRFTSYTMQKKEKYKQLYEKDKKNINNFEKLSNQKKKKRNDFGKNQYFLHRHNSEKDIQVASLKRTALYMRVTVCRRR